MEFLHRPGLKAVTLNTLVFAKKWRMPNSICETISRPVTPRFLDIGICRLIRGLSPIFRSASTQMISTSAWGRLAGNSVAVRSFGRMNVAQGDREDSPAPVSDSVIKVNFKFAEAWHPKPDASNEIASGSFVHGALCAYPGNA
jgi:hypothetical protein